MLSELRLDGVLRSSTCLSPTPMGAPGLVRLCADGTLPLAAAVCTPGRPIPACLCSKPIVLSPLVVHPRKQAVNGEAVWPPVRVEFLVGILVRHT